MLISVSRDTNCGDTRQHTPAAWVSDLSRKLHRAVRTQISQVLLHILDLWLLKTVSAADSDRRRCWLSPHRTTAVKIITLTYFYLSLILRKFRGNNQRKNSLEGLRPCPPGDPVGGVLWKQGTGATEYNKVGALRVWEKTPYFQCWTPLRSTPVPVPVYDSWTESRTGQDSVWFGNLIITLLFFADDVVLFTGVVSLSRRQSVPSSLRKVQVSG